MHRMVRCKTQKEIVFDVLPQAIQNARGDDPDTPISRRDLYYAVRSLYLAHPDHPYLKESKNKHSLEYGNFSQAMLNSYRDSYGEIHRLVSDSRGHLHEPHEGRSIELDTLTVADYEFPPFVFNSVLYIEKEGVWPKIQPYRLGERFDMAVVLGKGYPTEAVRDLLSMAHEGEQYTIFCFHDADPDGYNIYRTLQEETERMPEHNITVIDLGLTVAAAEEMELQSESVTLKKDAPKRIQPHLTDHERELFPEKKGESGYRYEINAILPVNRQAEYLESQIIATGLAEKIIPPNEYLHRTIEDNAEASLRLEADLAIDRVIDRDRIVDAVVDRYKDTINVDPEEAMEGIEAVFGRNPRRSWESVVKREKPGLTTGYDPDDIEEAVRDEIEESM